MGSFDKHNFGSIVKRSKSTPFSPWRKSSSSSGQILCRVEDIILDETHPDYNSEVGPSQIGRIRASAVTSDYKISQKIIFANPESSNLKHYPKKDEYVFAKKAFSPNNAGGKWVYTPIPVALFNNAPNSNEYPSQTTDLTPPSQQVDYTQATNGAYSVANPDFQPNETTTPPDQPIIHPLMPFNGDVLYEGRNGQSIRFGGTSKSNSQWANNWSTSGNEGDPITILRNGQPKKLPSLGWIPITENISEDQSSIYLTSTQKIPIKDDYWGGILSYKSSDKPEQPSLYSKPQIVLSSDRILINSKTDSILFRSSNSIGLSSFKSINIDSPTTVIKSSNIFLGDINATERGVKGDKLHDKLQIILNTLIILTRVLEVNQLWPGGLPSPDGGLMTASSSTKAQLQKELDSLSDILSKVVKTL